jgi:hypothetical protein
MLFCSVFADIDQPFTSLEFSATRFSAERPWEVVCDGLALLVWDYMRSTEYAVHVRVAVCAIKVEACDRECPAWPLRQSVNASVLRMKCFPALMHLI